MPARPKITKEKLEEAIAAFRIGADNAGAAHLIGVSKRGLEKYFERHPEADLRMREAKEIADDRVVGALFKAAVGGNITACIFWMKNRRPSQWRDRREIGLGSIDDPAELIARAHAEATKGSASPADGSTVVDDADDEDGSDG